MNAVRIPQVAPLTFLILAVAAFAGLAHGVLTPTVMADGIPDPWVGTYTVYERVGGESYRLSKRHNGSVTIDRKGAVFTIDFAPKTELRQVNEHVLDAGESSGNPRRVEIQRADGQRVLVVQSSFHTIYLVQGTPPKTWKLAPTVEEHAPRLPEANKWDLRRDYKVDGNLEKKRSEPQTSLALQVRGGQISGHFWERMAGSVNNNSTFSGEVVTREKTLLILRQEDKKDGTYVVIHAGHQIGENHYRGVWHDNSGQSGDFELKVSK